MRGSRKFNLGSPSHIAIIATCDFQTEPPAAIPHSGSTHDILLMSSHKQNNNYMQSARDCMAALTST